MFTCWHGLHVQQEHHGAAINVTGTTVYHVLVAETMYIVRTDLKPCACMLRFLAGLQRCLLLQT
jgi:hypothetical protein